MEIGLWAVSTVENIVNQCACVHSLVCYNQYSVMESSHESKICKGERDCCISYLQFAYFYRHISSHFSITLIFSCVRTQELEDLGWWVVVNFLMDISSKYLFCNLHAPFISFLRQERMLNPLKLSFFFLHVVSSVFPISVFKSNYNLDYVIGSRKIQGETVKRSTEK